MKVQKILKESTLNFSIQLHSAKELVDSDAWFVLRFSAKSSVLLSLPRHAYLLAKTTTNIGPSRSTFQSRRFQTWFTYRFRWLQLPLCLRILWQFEANGADYPFNFLAWSTCSECFEKIKGFDYQSNVYFWAISLINMVSLISSSDNLGLILKFWFEKINDIGTKCRETLVWESKSVYY